VGGHAPRAREDSMRPRRLVGASGRPLNFTVRRPMQTLQIGLDAWIIQDSDYDDFELGQEYKFALAFHPRALVVHPLKLVVVDGVVRPRFLSPVGHACYDVTGSVIFCSADAWAIDIGVPAYQDVQPPAKAKVGAAVSGRVYIGIDPYHYLERLAELPGMPDLTRLWFLHRILLETTPWIEAFDQWGRKYYARDESKRAYIDVSATDAFRHDKEQGGAAHYLLECELREPAAV